MQADGCCQEGLLVKCLLPSPTNQSLQHKQPTARTPNHPPPAEGERAEVSVDGAQQRLGTRQAQRHVPHIKVLHVVADLRGGLEWVGGHRACE